MNDLHDSILERCPLLLPLFRKLTVEIHCERTNQRSCDLRVESPERIHILEIQQSGSHGNGNLNSNGNGNGNGNGSINGRGTIQDSSGKDTKLSGSGLAQGLGQRLERKYGYTPSTYALSSSLSSMKKSSSSISSTAAYVNTSTTSDIPRQRLGGLSAAVAQSTSSRQGGLSAAVAQSTSSSGTNNNTSSFSKRSTLLQQEWQT